MQACRAHIRSTRLFAVKNSTVVTETKRTLALNVTKNSLVNSQGGKTTRNIDGIIYEIAYDSGSDVISVVNRNERLTYTAKVGSDNRIAIELDSAVPAAAGSPLDFAAWQQVLKFDGTGPEVVNCRTAMVAILGLLAVEATTHQTVLQQLTTPAGAAGAVALSAAVSLASIAPALFGNVPVNTVFPTANDSYPDRLLPYYFSYIAELTNGRLALVGIAGIIAQELVQGKAIL